MKISHFYSGLLFIPLLLPASCSSLSLAHAQKNKAVLTALPTIKEKKLKPFVRFLKKYKGKLSALLGFLWLWFLARFYTDEKRRRIPGWSFDDLTRLKLIKDSATRLWHHHPSRKIIKLKDWRE